MSECKHIAGFCSVYGEEDDGFLVEYEVDGSNECFLNDVSYYSERFKYCPRCGAKMEDM